MIAVAQLAAHELEPCGPQFFRMQSPEREKRWQPQIAAERARMSFAYLQLYTGDYLRDTRHLTPLKHGVYLLALMHCWDSKGPMPLDEQEAAGICNCRSADEIESLRYVLSRFFVCMEDGYYNERMQHEVEKCAVISGARSAAGRKGFQARAKQLPGKSQASAKQQHLSPSPSLSLSRASSAEPKEDHGGKPFSSTASTNGLAKYPPGFEDFYAQFPKKVGKDAAARAYGRRKFSGEDRCRLLEAIARQREWPTWKKNGGEFIPHPATWLNEGRWDDEAPRHSTNRADQLMADNDAAVAAFIARQEET